VKSISEKNTQSEMMMDSGMSSTALLQAVILKSFIPSWLIMVVEHQPLCKNKL
jgi:hypothetical protein